MTISEDHINKPLQVSSGLRLLVISTIFGLVNSLINETIRDTDRISIPMGLSISILTFGLLLFIIFQMSQRKKWARTTFLVLFIIGATTFPFTLTIIIGESPVIGIITVLLTLSQIISFVLLYSKSANQWFHLTVASQPG